jgi:hypothetical protein
VGAWEQAFFRLRKKACLSSWHQEWKQEPCHFPLPIYNKKFIHGGRFPPQNRFDIIVFL